jgi:Flp pilus assembly protein TadD
MKHHRAVKAVAVKAAVPEGMETVASPRPEASPTTATATTTTTTTTARGADAPRGAREILGEAEKLLSQGEVASACARGEEARQLAPKTPAISRFLGKCYMRAGNVPKASERYRTYLELAPDAPDAAFIKSIVK